MSVAEKEGREFFDALSAEDDLGCVVRSTIHIESYLIRLLEEAVHDPKPLEKMRLDYDARISLVLALGMAAEYGPPLRALGKLRNRFAHRLGMKLSLNDVQNIYGEFGQHERTEVQATYRAMHQYGLLKETSLARCSPRDQFALMVLTMRSSLRFNLDSVQKKNVAAGVALKGPPVEVWQPDPNPS